MLVTPVGSNYPAKDNKVLALGTKSNYLFFILSFIWTRLSYNAVTVSP